MGGGTAACDRCAEPVGELAPFKAFQVSRRIRCGTVALRAPHGFGKAIHDFVTGRMPVTESGCDPREFESDARRLIDGQLLLERKVHAHVQKRVGVARLGWVVPLLVTLGVFQHTVIFRMQQDNVYCDGIEPRQHPAFTILAPGVEEELPDLLAAGIEHGRGSWLVVRGSFFGVRGSLLVFGGA